MLGLRHKLFLGFGGLLAITLIIGAMSIVLLTELGESVDVILRENYRSVVACQDMKEALERMDSGILFVFLGYRNKGTQLIQENREKFLATLKIQEGNITIEGEAERTAELSNLFARYREALQEVSAPVEIRRTDAERYFSEILPLFQKIKGIADSILQMNQSTMSAANERARVKAAAARSRMLVLLIAGVAVAAVFMVFTGKWILKPIDRLTWSVDEISRGNLDLVVKIDSHDEIGRLSEEFNTMAERLREFRRTGQAHLMRIQRSTEQAFESLPDAIAVVDGAGTIEVATPTAAEAFGMKPETDVRGLPLDTVAMLFDQAIRTGRVAEPSDRGALIQKFIRGEERYFRPKAVPIVDSDGQPSGAVLVLTDVTQQRHQDELKKGLISTVSHELRTPLTSIRMAIHLLLEEKVGALTEKQAELLVTAREDAERLNSILEKLLDISRLESGKASKDLRPQPVHQLVFEAVEPFQTLAKERGISLSVNLADDVPEVLADLTLIQHAFANLLSNALKYTDPGGQVMVSAAAEEEFVRFAVSDTGRGIPAQYLEKVLEQFFRVPGQIPSSGVGLGLSIVKDIIDAHGGTIRVESGPGEGSKFSFTLKRATLVAPQELTNA